MIDSISISILEIDSNRFDLRIDPKSIQDESCMSLVWNILKAMLLVDDVAKEDQPFLGTKDITQTPIRYGWDECMTHDYCCCLDHFCLQLQQARGSHLASWRRLAPALFTPDPKGIGLQKKKTWIEGFNRDPSTLKLVWRSRTTVLPCDGLDRYEEKDKKFFL